MDAPHRLELIDDAMLRPGRLGKLLYVPLPDATDRIAILKALVRSVIAPPLLLTLSLYVSLATRIYHIKILKYCTYYLIAFQHFLMKVGHPLILSMSLLN
jgi:SpoVK/Ycf46/Vps4 family AAA+-type ATPase